MPIIVHLGGVEAYYTDEWRSHDKGSEVVTETLNAMMLDPMDVSGADPYPMLTKTKIMMQRLGGTIIDEGEAPDSAPDVVY